MPLRRDLSVIFRDIRKKALPIGGAFLLYQISQKKSVAKQFSFATALI
jgi:hypothetical protein